MKERRIDPALYDKKFFLTQCGGFEEFLKGGIGWKLLYAFSLADIKEGMQILDVGTGRGELAVKCAEAGAHAKGIDYSQAAIKISKESLKRVDKEVAKRVVFERMDAKKISYPGKSFDVVFMIDVIEHLYPEETKPALLEIKRVLKPGGRVIIHTPNIWPLKPLYFLAGVFFQWWEKQRVHVNEQSFFSLHRNLSLFGGKRRVFLRPRGRYFSGALYGAVKAKKVPAWTVRLAGLLDRISENKAVSFCIYHTPLVFFLGTDLWAVVETPREVDD